LPRALALLDGAADIERLSRAGDVQLRALRIGASTTLGNYLLPRLLARVYRGPGAADSTWHAQVTIANTAAIGRAVAACELDVGFVEGTCHEPELESLAWLRDELVLVGPPAPSSDAARTVPLRALREAVWLLREPGSGTREATDRALLPQLRSYRRSIELGSSEAIKRAAMEGVGIACLSRWVVDDMLAAGRLRELRTSLPKVVRPCHVVLHRYRQRTAALTALLAMSGARAAA